jgi:O-acetylserine/cysteine efflux transporter
VNLRHSALALLVAVLWGLNFVAIDLGLHPDGAEVPPLLFVVLRFTLVVIPCIFFIRKPDVSWKAIVGVGLFMSAGQFGLLYLAMALGMPAGLASLVIQAQVLLTVLLAAGLLGERPSRAQLAGVVLGVAGLAVVAVGRSLSAPVLPLVIVLAAALSWAAGNIVVRKAKAASGLGLVVWSGALVPLPLLGLSLLLDGPAALSAAVAQLEPVTWVSALYTAVFGSLVGYGIWNRLLGLYPSSAVVPFTLLVPVVGMTAAWLVLGEVPSPAELLGGVLLLCGVATAVLRPRRPVWQTQRRVVVLAEGRAGDGAADLAAGSPPAGRGVARGVEVLDTAVVAAAARGAGRGDVPAVALLAAEPRADVPRDPCPLAPEREADAGGREA